MSGDRTAAVTGASGYLGGLIAGRLEETGLAVRRLVRKPRAGEPGDRRFVLGEEVPGDVLEGVAVLVHCAYDLELVSESQIWQVNVAGTRRLLEAAAAAGVERVVVLSSMSAYPGTTQLYGRAKLEIESETLARGGVVLRPGLVYGPTPGGMAGSLRKVVRLPVVPLLGGSARQFTVHEDDLAATVLAAVTVEPAPTVPISVAHPAAVTFGEVLGAFAAAEHRHPRFVPVPWQLVAAGLRAGERFGMRLPFRSDSLLGLVRSAPGVVGADELARLGVSPRPFAPAAA